VQYVSALGYYTLDGYYTHCYDSCAKPLITFTGCVVSLVAHWSLLHVTVVHMLWLRVAHMFTLWLCLLVIHLWVVHYYDARLCSARVRVTIGAANSKSTESPFLATYGDDRALGYVDL
jgi:hypothetical protein